MKQNKILSIFTIFCILFGTCININAKYKQEVLDKENNQEEIYLPLADDDLVLLLPDGGVLHGEATIRDCETLEILEEYNSLTDSNSITYKEMKENISKNNSPIQPRGATPPTREIVLGPGASYSSSGFSGNGWRFSGYRFIARSDTGYYLKWTSIGDDARIGDLWQATETKKKEI